MSYHKYLKKYSLSTHINSNVHIANKKDNIVNIVKLVDFGFISNFVKLLINM